MSGSRLVLPAQQPVQSTGLPYAGGKLFFYVTGTTTPANTYQDVGLITPNTNPVILDSSGDAGNVFLDTSIIYKVVLEDANNNLIWTFDPVYPFALGNIQSLVYAGTTTGSNNAQNLAGIAAPFDGQTIVFTAGFTNTTSATLNTGAGAVLFNRIGTSGPGVLTGGEVVTGNSYFATYRSALNANAGGWQIIGVTFSTIQALITASISAQPPIPPTGRLTLTSGVPVLSSAVNSAATIYYTPYRGAVIPLWSGSAFVNTTFSEISQLLIDATKSPAAAVAASAYDLFVWNDAGTVRLSRGPVWTNVTTRSAGTAIARVNGILVNSIAITNGPGAGAGTYVGTIATDAGGATVTFDPAPAAASGGPTNGAWVGLWNQYNRAAITAYAQDSKASWSTSSTSWQTLDGSTNNRVTFISGIAEDGVRADAQISALTTNSLAAVGLAIGLDSTTVAASANQAVGTANFLNSISVISLSLPLLGQHYVQALQSAGAANTVSYIGTTTPSAQSAQISAQLSY